MHHLMEDTSAWRMSWALESAEVVRVQLVKRVKKLLNKWCLNVCLHVVRRVVISKESPSSVARYCMLCDLSLQVGSSFSLLPYCVCLSMLLCAKCGSQVETGVVLHEEVISIYLHWALTWSVQVVRVILCWPCYRHQHRVAMSGDWMCLLFQVFVGIGVCTLLVSVLGKIPRSHALLCSVRRNKKTVLEVKECIGIW